MGDIFPWRKCSKVQPAPAVHANSAQKPQYAAGFMFAVRPQLGKAGCKFCVG